MKYQKRYKPKTKFEKFLKVYFIVPLSVSECFLKIFSTEKRVVLINISYFLWKGGSHRQQNNKINQATVVAENSVGIPH